MMPIRNVLIPNNSGSDAGRPVRALQMLHELFLKLLREPVYKPIRVIPEHLHLPLVALRQAVALKPILVAALLLAHLAVPLELLQPLGLDPVGDCLRRQKLVLPHVRKSSATNTHSHAANVVCSRK